MEAFTSGITNATSLMGTAFEAMTSNEICLIFLGVALLGVGITVFKKIKGAAR